MRKLLAMTAMVFCIGVGSVRAQDKVVIGGSGSIIEELQELAKVYRSKHAADNIEVLGTPMSTTGGMQGTKAGRLQIGVVTRAPREGEKESLVYRGMGRSGVVIGVNKSNPVTNVTEAQLCDIFSGRIKSWKEVGGRDEKIVVLTRKTDDNNAQTLYEMVSCFKGVTVTPDAITLVRGSDVLNALNSRPTTIGISSYGSNLKQRENVKTLAIDGVPVSEETIKSGKYKFYREIGVVTAGEPQGLIKKFLDFAYSAEGMKIMTRRGLMPIA